jgi:ribosomal protein L23
VKNALHKFWDVDVTSIRVLRVGPKRRVIGPGKSMEKRHRSKRMIITLSKKSKAFDISSFRTT